MGMYDSFRFDESPIFCPEGHRVGGEWQTKDLDCVLAAIDIAPDGATRVAFDGYTDDVGGYANLTATVDVYASCEECRPVYAATSMTGSFSEVRPGIVARLTLADGRMVAHCIVNAETVADVIASFNDPVAVFAEIPPQDQHDAIARRIRDWHAGAMTDAR